MSENQPPKREPTSSGETPLSAEQKLALADLIRNPQNIEALVGVAAAWSTENIYREALLQTCATVDAQNGFEAGSSELVIENDAHLMLYFSYQTLINVILPLQDKLLLGLGTLDNLYGWREYIGVRFAAQTMATSRLIRNMPRDSLQMEAAYFEQSSSEPLVGLAQLFPRSIIELKNMQNTLQKIPVNPHKEAHSAKLLAQANDNLFRAARRLQKGAIESTYVADNTPLPFVEWHALDRRQIVEKAIAINNQIDERSIGLKRAIAIFRGFSHPLADKTFEVEVTSNLGVRSQYIQTTKAGEGPGPREVFLLEFTLCDDGHLSTEKEVPLAWLADKLNLSWQYELIRARVISIYTDIVLPRHVIDNSSEIQAAERQIAGKTRSRSNDFTNLIAARLKAIEQYPNLNTLLE